MASFLLDISERMRSDVFDLPMSRTDIGDYLGLTIETVSRIFSQFARDSLIGLINRKRHVVLLNKPA